MSSGLSNGTINEALPGSVIQDSRLTVLHRLDQQGNYDMVSTWHPMNFEVLGQVARSIDESFRKEALTVVSLPVFDQQRVLRELCSPCDNDSY